MLPELQAFLNELNEEIEKGNEEKEIIEAKKDIVSYIEELNQILKLIEEKNYQIKMQKICIKKLEICLMNMIMERIKEEQKMLRIFLQNLKVE